MRVPRRVAAFLTKRLMRITKVRAPDEVIGPGVRSRLRDGHVPVDKAFLHRWFVIPKNKWCNIYLHCFTRDDEDRALHDHPWWNVSLLLDGSYIEHSIAKGGVHHRQILIAGDLKFRAPWDAHRVECLKRRVPRCKSRNPRTIEAALAVGDFDLEPIPCWSLFITGPVQHGWGFHCPGEWRSQKDFAAKGGCGKEDYAPDGQLRGYHHDDIVAD